MSDEPHPVTRGWELDGSWTLEAAHRAAARTLLPTCVPEAGDTGGG